MPSSFPPLAALFLTHFHDLTGQEVIYYASLSDETLPPHLIEHTSLPSGMHLLDEDLITFTHHELPGAGLFRSHAQVEGRGRRMGTLGAVLAPPGASEDVFDLEGPLQHVYDQLEGVENPFASTEPDKSAVKALLDTIWEQCKAKDLGASRVQHATIVASRLSKRTSPSSPVTYMPALLSLLGPTLVTVYKASLSGKRILLYSSPPLLPLGAFAWCIWAMGLPPSGASTAGARSSVWLGNVGLMQLDSVKKRTGGWVATTSDVVYKSHTGAYDVFIDFSASFPADGSDTRAPQLRAQTPPTVLTSNSSVAGGKPTTSTASYAFGDLALYRSLVLLDQSPRGVRAETVGFSATNRTGGMWLVVFEMLERVWNLCIGVCEFALGRGNVGHRPVALRDGEDDSRYLLHADAFDDEDDDDNEPLQRAEATGEDEEEDFGPIPDDTARRGRLILDQLHHNAYHLYGHLLAVAAGGWELSDAQLRTLTGASRLSPWGGRASPDAQFWLALARTWNVEPDVASDTGAGATEADE